jgi:aminotransferase
MRNFVSKRAEEIPPSGIRKFFDLVQTMEGVISLGVGEPDFRTPWNICESSIYSIEQGTTSYTSNKGLQTLRDSLSQYLAQHYNLRYSADNEMIITTGVSEGLDIAVRSVVDPGDEVLIAQPSYVSYAPCVTLAGGKPVPIRCTEKDHFKLNPDGRKNNCQIKSPDH